MPVKWEDMISIGQIYSKLNWDDWEIKDGFWTCKKCGKSPEKEVEDEIRRVAHNYMPYMSQTFVVDLLLAHVGITIPLLSIGLCDGVVHVE